MSNNTQATTFWNFLKENTIEIPIIQRDYAQGRLGKENLRKNFLADLKNALDSNEIMKLDFVYGSIEKDYLNPLDGQQRLTTLWLLHWYIALRAGELNEENCKIFKKFTYETRISSREFCQNLCNSQKIENFDGNDIVGFIIKQTWFYSAWKQDPTIQSMLRMLGGTKKADKKGEDIDGIEEIFQGTSEDNFKEYWGNLTQKETIVFYHLPLKDFGLSDDLYIKMNARGKQLTSFENFKADLIGYITKQSEDVSLEESEQTKWKELLDLKNGIPIKLDTDWTDIFWKNRSIGITDKESEKRKSDQIDEIYFAFLNRFFWNELFIGKKADNSEVHILDIGKVDESSTQENNNSSYKYLNNSEHNNDATIAYEGLDVYRYDNGTIPLLFFRKIKRVLDNYFTYSKCNCLPECPWETSFRFIPIYEVKDGSNIEITNNTNDKILSVSTLNQVQRIVFFAVCKYFDHDDKVEDDKTSLKQWMRVVWNLVSGEDQNGRPEIRSTSAMRTAIEFINLLDPHNVYNSLVMRNVSGTTSFDERCKEEIAKAEQILNGGQRTDGKNWEEIIIEAEKYAFFKGTIRFLFQNAEGKVTNDSWKQFDTKWDNAQKYFDENGVKDKTPYKDDALLMKTLLANCDNFWKNIWSRFEFSNDKVRWKRILTSDNWKIAVDAIMKEEVTKETTNSFVNTIEDPYIKNIVDDDLMNYVCNKMSGAWLRSTYHGYQAIWISGYPASQIVLNPILAQLKIDYRDKNRIENCRYYKCVNKNVDFKYKFNDTDYFFNWKGNPSPTELDVYLTEENWNGYKKRPNPTTDKGTEEDTHYCFRVTKEMEKDTSLFTKELDRIINEAIKNDLKSAPEQ